ncbi:uncharacterized protein DC041_0005262 [Schistosoma bovis]|uniref:G-protein coupled receptors family 1 profile domain-containing protein n=1 Tax=Schistosoma bovis TaxID=6184 RepID=A0A430QSL5_SCHBO|nr:uncharacterized protein DC041_0005262 [Schistosoma bovis]CAH8458677.1 unnamed protein product [Schistosoma bovis]
MLSMYLKLRIVTAIEGFIGTILNLLTLFIVFKTQFGSKSTTLLLRLQTIFDCTACFLYAMYSATENENLLNNKNPTDISFINELLCYLWSYNIAFWSGVILSVQNIVCISIDRFIAVLFPIIYKTHQLLLIIIFITYQLGMIGLLFTPIIFFRRFDNDTCIYVPGPNGIDSSTYIAFRGYTWLSFQYIIPVLIITISHLSIIIKLKKRQYQSKTLRPIEVSLRNKGCELNEQKKLIKLVLITAIMSGQQATLHLYESIRYFLTMLNIVIFGYGTIGQQMGPFLIVLSSCINPCIIIGTTVSVRRRFSHYLHEIWIKIRRG